MERFIPLILFTVLTNFLSQITLKKGMSIIGASELGERSMVAKLLEVFMSPYVIGGLLLMVVSMGAHLIVLSKVDISFAYPFLGLSFVFISVYGYFVLGEPMTAWKFVGTTLIFLGVALVAKSA